MAETHGSRLPLVFSVAPSNFAFLCRLLALDAPPRSPEESLTSLTALPFLIALLRLSFARGKLFFPYLLPEKGNQLSLVPRFMFEGLLPCREKFLFHLSSQMGLYSRIPRTHFDSSFLLLAIIVRESIEPPLPFVLQGTTFQLFSAHVPGHPYSLFSLTLSFNGVVVSRVTRETFLYFRGFPIKLSPQRSIKRDVRILLHQLFFPWRHSWALVLPPPFLL